MKKSEKVLAAITAIAVVYGAFYYGTEMLGGGEEAGGESLLGASADDVERARDDYDEKVQTIESAPDIYREFYELVGENTSRAETGEEGERTRADLEFQKDVAAYCASVGFNRPRINSDVEDIRDAGGDIVTEYQLVIVDVSIDNGDVDRISRLLKVFDRSGLIIQDLRLESHSEGEEMRANIKVARLVEFFRMTRAQREARRNS